MSKRTDSHTLSHAENIYSGDAYQAGAEGNGRGIPRASLVQVDLGTPAILDANGLVASEDSGAAPSGGFPFALTLDGALVTSGVGIFDVPRGVQVVAAGACTSVFVFFGTDKYGVPIQESVTGNGNTPVFGLKAFKTVTSVTVSKDTETAVTVGSSDVLGLPFRLENVADVVVIDENDNNVYQVTGQTAANPAAATAAASALTASATGALTAAAAALTASATGAITGSLGAMTIADNTGSAGGTPAAGLVDVTTVIPAVNGSGATVAQETEYNANMVKIANNQDSIDARLGEAKVDIDVIKTAVDAVLVDDAAQKVVIDQNVVDVAGQKVELDKILTDNAAQKVVIDQNVVDVADQKEEIDKLITDVEAIRAEVIKLVTDGAAVDTGTLVKADATVTATATTGDVRGTYNPTMVLDGSKTLKMTFKPKGRNTRGAYGSVQFRA